MPQLSFATHEVFHPSPILSWLSAEASGLPGVGGTIEFIRGAFLRPDSERGARLAVEKLALLAACAALNQVNPRHAELLAATRLASTHPGMYGAIDLDGASMRTLLEHALQ